MKPLRIAMWSGPRNISTAMLRAFENREDTLVCDEPFYAYYLHETGAPHPLAQEVMAAQPTNWREVVEGLLAPVPKEKSVYYQKHMTHHLLPTIGRDWFAAMTHCFLIRDPAEVIASYHRARPTVQITQEDIGILQQEAIFDYVVERSDKVPPIVDARDVLQNPSRLLSLLCEALEIPFTERMLEWPTGPRNSDGVWASHWYASVWRSSGFAEYQPKTVELTAEHEQLARACQPSYQRLYKNRLGR